MLNWNSKVHELKRASSWQQSFTCFECCKLFNGKSASIVLRSNGTFLLFKLLERDTSELVLVAIFSNCCPVSNLGACTRNVTFVAIFYDRSFQFRRDVGVVPGRLLHPHPSGQAGHGRELSASRCSDQKMGKSAFHLITSTLISHRKCFLIVVPKVLTLSHTRS